MFSGFICLTSSLGCNHGRHNIQYYMFLARNAPQCERSFLRMCICPTRKEIGGIRYNGQLQLSEGDPYSINSLLHVFVHRDCGIPDPFQLQQSLFHSQCESPSQSNRHIMSQRSAGISWIPSISFMCCRCIFCSTPSIPYHESTEYIHDQMDRIRKLCEHHMSLWIYRYLSHRNPVFHFPSLYLYE